MANLSSAHRIQLPFLAKEGAMLVTLLLCIVGSVLSVDPAHGISHMWDNIVDGPGQFRTSRHDSTRPTERISARHEAVHILSCVESWLWLLAPGSKDRKVDKKIKSLKPSAGRSVGLSTPNAKRILLVVYVLKRKGKMTLVCFET